MDGAQREGLSRLASAPQPLLGFEPVFDNASHPMSHLTHHHRLAAKCGVVCAGAAWLDAGVSTGLIVVDSNRPAFGAGSARGLLKQFVAAH